MRSLSYVFGFIGLIFYNNRFVFADEINAIEPNNEIKPDLYDACSGSTPSETLTSRIAACPGFWHGHVETADHLCSRSYKVCSWKEASILNEIPWSVAMNLTGCYAINAAQDGNTCSPCKNDVSMDDLAAVGKHCPHVNFGQKGCLDQGRMDASCCVASLSRRACTYVPGVITGVLCCYDEHFEYEKLLSDGRKSTIQMSQLTGQRIVLNCVANRNENGQMPAIFWAKNEQHIADSDDKDSIKISFARNPDSGIFACQQRNHDDKASIIVQFNLTVSEVTSSACADGTSEGFHFDQNVRGCAGRWKGHIRRADKQLCGNGWRVCTPKDRKVLQKVNNTYLTDFGGCFGYNAAQIKSKCRRCQNKYSMAGLGRDCAVNELFSLTARGKNGKLKQVAASQKLLAPEHRNLRHSCFENRVVQVYSSKFLKLSGALGCVFNGHQKISGVLCCRKSAVGKSSAKFGVMGSNHDQNLYESLPAEEETLDCYPSCRNGGVCYQGVCKCKEDYFGNVCQHGGCNSKCENGGVCLYGFCRCVQPFFGETCQNKSSGISHDENATYLATQLVNELNED